MKSELFSCAKVGARASTCLLFLGLAGCASLQEIDQTPHAASFPSAPGRTYYLKKSPFRTTILVCDAGPREAYCFEKPR